VDLSPDNLAAIRASTEYTTLVRDDPERAIVMLCGLPRWLLAAMVGYRGGLVVNFVDSEVVQGIALDAAKESSE
jgi:hypothetical protein